MYSMTIQSLTVRANTGGVVSPVEGLSPSLVVGPPWRSVSVSSISITTSRLINMVSESHDTYASTELPSQDRLSVYVNPVASVRI